jgi:Helix-turn-helix domain
MSAQISPQTQDFNKTRAAFMERASAPHVPPVAFKLAWLISYRYMNRESRIAYPPQDRLARDLNVSVRTVQRLLDILERLGLGITPGDGRGKASTYWLDPLTAKAEERATPMSSFQGQKGDKKGRHPTPKKGDTHVAPTLLKRTKKEIGPATQAPISSGERERASRADDPPLGGDPPACAGPPRQASLPLTPTASPRNDRKESTEEERFTELRAIWQRGHLSDDDPKNIAIARAAHKRACQRAEPGEINARARECVAAKEAGDGVRYLDPLPRWLDQDGWTKPPPKPKRQRAGNGNGRHRDNLPRTNGNKIDGARLAFQGAGYVADDDGKLYHPDGDEGSSFDWRASL